MLKLVLNILHRLIPWPVLALLGGTGGGLLQVERRVRSTAGSSDILKQGPQVP